MWLPDGLRFSTSAESRKGRNLLRDPRVAVHLESGDQVVLLEGEVERVAIDDPIADTYEAKYGYRPDPSADGLWFRLRPRVAYAWLERDYPRTATRFAFDDDDERRQALIEWSVGSIPDTGHEWDDDPAAWVSAQRRADPRRVG